MSNVWRVLLSLLLCLVLIASFYLVITSLFVRHTLFSAAYYQSVTASPDYLPLLRRSIENDLQTQSNFVAIPIEHLQAGLDEHLLYVRLRHHVQYTVAFLNMQSDFVKAEYPSDQFYEPLVAFIDEHGAAEGYQPSPEQYELLAEVAVDSAALVERHINVFNLDLVRGMAAFGRLHRLLFLLSRLFWPALAAFLLSAGLLMLMQRHDWRRGLLYTLSSLWLAGSLLAVPALVLELFGLTRRLAIETPYLKYAADQLLTRANHYFLFWGLLVLLLCSAGLIARELTSRPRKTSARSRRG